MEKNSRAIKQSEWRYEPPGCSSAPPGPVRFFALQVLTDQDLLDGHDAPHARLTAGVLGFHSHFRVSFLHPRLVDLRSMASPAAVPKPRRRRGKVVLQDVDLLKSQRQKLKQDLKEMTRNLKLQLQKKRRIMRAANLMEDEDLHWLLKERERAKSNQAAQEEVNAEQNGVPE